MRLGIETGSVVRQGFVTQGLDVPAIVRHISSPKQDHNVWTKITRLEPCLLDLRLG